MSAPDLVLALMPVVEALEALGVRHYVGGAVASSAHGVARASLDVDVVADLRDEQVPPFVARLASAYYVDEGRAREAVRARQSFNLIHLGTMLKVDVFVSKGRAFDEEALRRARPQALAETPDAPRVAMASAEDTVLAKLEWFQAGGEVSQRQWSDIIGVLTTSVKHIDREYLRHWAEPLGVVDLLDRAFGEVDRDTA